MGDLKSEHLVEVPAYASLGTNDRSSLRDFSQEIEPGDVLLLHPGTLHGGAPVDAGFPNRHTFVFRFFGDDATYSPLPDKSRWGCAVTGTLFREEMSSLKAGEPFRSPVFQQLV